MDITREKHLAAARAKLTEAESAVHRAELALTRDGGMATARKLVGLHNALASARRERDEAAKRLRKLEAR